MHERGQNKLKGFRNAAGSAVLAMSIAACGNTGTETPSPTILPTEKPTPTLIVTPSPEVTPTPIVTPEITPTPEPTPIPVSNLIDQIITDGNTNGWAKVSEQDVLNSINEAYTKDPEAAALINPATNTLEKEVVNKVWKNCSTNQDTSVQVLACAGLIGHLYYEGYSVDMNDVWLEPINNVVKYAHENLVKQDFNSFETYASGQQAPF